MKLAKLKMCACTVLSLFLFATAGCGAIAFKTQEEASNTKKATEDISTATMPASLKVTSLVYDNALVLPQGAETAKYHAELPQFEEIGDKAPIIKKINEFYTNEFAALPQDCESYFGIIRAAYGNTWETATAPASVYGAKLSYDVVGQTDEFISVQTTYKYTDINMREKYVYSGETFDCTTGWPMKLNELFIADSTRVNSVISEQITLWAVAAGADAANIQPFDISKNEYSFAISDQILYLCLDQTAISAETPGGLMCAISRSALSEIIETKEK